MLYGRDAERSYLGELLQGVRDFRSAALVIRGEAGIGKSALLEDARAQAADLRVLSCQGVESEAQLPFAAVDQLLRPIVGHLEALPERQADALRGALGLAQGGSDERFLVSVAILSLLADAAERGPLLCVIDDAHWLDDASADALGFVARRLGADGILMLFATREGEARRFEASGLPELQLGGIDADDARALMDQRTGVALSPEARERLIVGTDGNPLALLEVPLALTEAQRAGSEPWPDPLPVGARVEQAFLSRLCRLPEETQVLVLVAAADDTGELATVLGAARMLGADAEALDAAEQRGLVRIQENRLEFRHPLVRSAIYQGASLSRRRDAHRALAGALDGEAEADRRAWHLAAASAEPDRAVVEDLERAAERAVRRTGYAAASVAYERAATLTPDEPNRARRLIAAAENAWLAGRPERALALFERARALATEPLRLADINRGRGIIEMYLGVPAEASALLADAAAEIVDLDRERALYMLTAAILAASYAGDNRAAVAVAESLGPITASDGPVVRFLGGFVSGSGAYFAGAYTRAASSLREALEAADAADAAGSARFPALPLLFGVAALYLGDDRATYRFNRVVVARARETGALGLLTQAIPRLAVSEIWAGHWPAASASLTEGVGLAREIGQHQIVGHLLALLAVVAALQGDEDECRSLVAESQELASAHHLGNVVNNARWALTLLELGSGQFDEALASARQIGDSPVALHTALDRVEAAVRAGDPETARAWLASFESWAESTGAAWANRVALRSRALLSDDAAEADRLFLAALDAHPEAERPFERARTELARGEFLRRARRRIEAGEHLGTALDAFTSLGAESWAERTRVELRASGRTARRRDPSTRDQLTPQERQIAQLVAEGNTNREVAGQLFLSPRTIDFHLRNVFRKLDIASRTELARIDLDSVGEP